MDGIKVTVEDLKTGRKESRVIMDDYILVTAGHCYEASVTVHQNGTHQIVIKGVNPKDGNKCFGSCFSKCY